MGKRVFDSNIQNIMDEIRRIKSTRPEESVRLCEQLTELNEEKKDWYVEIFANIAYADSIWRLGKIDKSILYSYRAITFQEEHGISDMLIEAYNGAGTAYMSSGDEQSALNFYLKALKYIDKISPEESIEKSGIIASVYNNIGELYKRFGDNRTACEYYNKAREKICNEEKYDSLCCIVEVNLAEAYFYIGDYDSCKEYINILEKSREKDYYISFETTIQRIKASYNLKEGNREEAYECVKRIMNIMGTIPEKINIFPDYIETARILLELNMEKAAKYMLLFIEKEANTIDHPKYYLDYSILRIEFLKHIGVKDKDEFIQETDRLLDYQKKYEEYQKSIRLTSVNNQIKLDEVISENEKMQMRNRLLKAQSEHDALTGLNNRYGFNEFVDIKFEEAKNKKSRFGLIIMDIDYFKEYNDNYGHLAGDECLQQVAASIKQYCDNHEDLFSARYGGDEFFVVVIDRDDEQVRQLADNIRINIEDKNIIHEHSRASDHVTITQGYTNSIPEAKNTVSDFIKSADVALYDAKKLGRNRVCNR